METKAVSTDPSYVGEKFSPPFNIKWIKRYDNIESGQGLSFNRTQDICITTGSEQKTINLARNGQQIDYDIGKQICDMITEEVERDEQERLRKQQEVPKVEHFFVADEKRTTEETWEDFLSEAGKSGKITAKDIGSRCYNLHTPQSDSDMFVIVAFPTEQLLALEPPQLSIKNREGFEPDFTLHDIASFVELILVGDTKMVEALYQDKRIIVSESPEFTELRPYRSEFITKSMVRKYLKEIHGPKGFKILETLMKENKPEERERTHKKFYILLRLLYLALQIVEGHELQLWMDEDLPERKYLMSVRGCQHPLDTLLNEARTRDKMINEKLATCSLPESCEQMGEILNQWVLKIRYNSFKEPFPEAKGVKLENVQEYPLLSQVPGDVICVTELPNGTQTGIYVVHIDQLLSVLQKLKIADIQLNTKCLISEIGKFAKLLMEGHPNVIWPLFLGKVLFESPEWNELRQQRDSFITHKTIFQSIGLIRGLITAVERSKIPKVFEYDKGYPQMWLLNECLSKAQDKKRQPIPSSLEDQEGLAFARQLLQECKDINLEQHPSFQPIMNKDNLQQWIIKVRKIYIKR